MDHRAAGSPIGSFEEHRAQSAPDSSPELANDEQLLSEYLIQNLE